MKGFWSADWFVFQPAGNASPDASDTSIDNAIDHAPTDSNDTSTIDAGQARITVRHTAAAPAVDVRANGDVAFEGLTNPNEVKTELPAGTISADVVLAGTDTVAIGPADVELKEGTNTIVYAWGSADQDSLDLAVQTVSGMNSAPDGVPAGGGTSSNDAGRYALIAGSAALAGGMVLVTRRRATSRA